MAQNNAINNQSSQLTIDPAEEADSFVQFDESTTGKWRIGNDATDDTFRLSIGSALGTNDVMIWDTNGNFSFPLASRFYAYRNVALTNVTGNGTLYTLAYDVERYDTGGDYDASTFIFTAPIAGKYMFGFSVRLTNFGTTDINTMVIETSNLTYVQATNNPTSGIATANGYSNSVVIQAEMDLSDTASFQIVCAGAGADTVDLQTSSTSNHSWGHIMY